MCCMRARCVYSGHLFSEASVSLQLLGIRFFPIYDTRYGRSNGRLTIPMCGVPDMRALPTWWGSFGLGYGRGGGRWGWLCATFSAGQSERDDTSPGLPAFRLVFGFRA